MGPDGRSAFCRTFLFSVMVFGLVPSTRAAAQTSPASDALTFEAEYVHDLTSVAQGADTGLRRTDYTSLSADLSLDSAIGWNGANLFVHAIASTGGRPNDLAGTMQGVNNIEVPVNRVRLFEAYLEQKLPGIRGSLRLGFSDLNSEFYTNEAAGLLLGPAFGIGSELAATGANGPAIFPSTSATARLRIEHGEHGYVQFAAVNGEAGVPGDPGGIRPLLRNGALLIGEMGIAAKGKFSIGAWTYTQRQDDIRLTTPGGDPVGSRARGAYLLAEHPIIAESLAGFVRAGISDGNTTPYSGGWQAGVLASRVIAGRPQSQLSIGVNQAFLSAKYRANAAESGESLRSAETAAEITYSDSLASWLTVQPDVSYVWNPSRAASSRNALVLTLRLRAGFAWP
jgi:porin